MHKETYELEREGYIKITYELDKNDRKRHYILLGEHTIPTDAQIKHLYNTFGNDPDVWDEMSWRIRVRRISEARRANSEKDSDKK